MRRQYLQQRAELLQRVRQFFVEREFLEVETPLVCDEVIPELHIDPVPAKRGQDSFPPNTEKSPGPFLQASPEMHMKRLLCAGLPAIFQITRSFRDGERGRLHSPEFTIVEWYRVGDDMAAGIDLLDELCQYAAESPPAARTSYAELFQDHAGVDAHRASCAQLAARSKELGLDCADFDGADRDEWLNLLLAARIEHQLGKREPVVVYDYPATQSALARIEKNSEGVEVARRFELYWQGVELANGYDELTSADELRRRLEQVNERRRGSQRGSLPLPESLLAAMHRPGLPDCSGCALGFDRLAMLVCGADSIHEVAAGSDPSELP